MERVAILGASGPIGKHLARRLVQHGGQVLLIGRSHEKLAALSHDLDQPFTVVDMSTSSSLEEKLRTDAEHNGGFSGLVNCIGSVLLKPGACHVG